MRAPDAIRAANVRYHDLAAPHYDDKRTGTGGRRSLQALALGVLEPPEVRAARRVDVIDRHAGNG